MTHKMNRRTMLQQTAAALGASALVAAAPAGQGAGRLPAADARLYRPHLTPQERRDHDDDHRIVLAALLEVLAALDAAAELHEDGCDCDLCGEVRGLRYHFKAYAALVSGEAFNEADARAEARRRLAEGPPDPVWRVEIALERVKPAVVEVWNRHVDRGCPGCNLCDDADGIYYAADLWAHMFSCIIQHHLTPESKKARLKKLVADYHAGRLPAVGKDD